LGRVQAFLTPWNSRGGAALARYQVCTDAVTDYLIAGLCRISEPGTLCEPKTFLPRVASSIGACRELAVQTARAQSSLK
jgi:hypothetical protein